MPPFFQPVPGGWLDLDEKNVLYHDSHLSLRQLGLSKAQLARSYYFRPVPFGVDHVVAFCTSYSMDFLYSLVMPRAASARKYTIVVALDFLSFHHVQNHLRRLALQLTYDTDAAALYTCAFGTGGEAVMCQVLQIFRGPLPRLFSTLSTEVVPIPLDSLSSLPSVDPDGRIYTSLRGHKAWPSTWPLVVLQHLLSRPLAEEAPAFTSAVVRWSCRILPPFVFYMFPFLVVPRSRGAGAHSHPCSISHLSSGGCC